MGSSSSSAHQFPRPACRRARTRGTPPAGTCRRAAHWHAHAHGSEATSAARGRCARVEARRSDAAPTRRIRSRPEAAPAAAARRPACPARTSRTGACMPTSRVLSACMKARGCTASQQGTELPMAGGESCDREWPVPAIAMLSGDAQRPATQRSAWRRAMAARTPGPTSTSKPATTAPRPRAICTAATPRAPTCSTRKPKARVSSA